MGIDRGITYEKLAAASLAIRAGAHFIATNGDKAFPTEKGLVPGNGSFVKLLERQRKALRSMSGNQNRICCISFNKKGIRKKKWSWLAIIMKLIFRQDPFWYRYNSCRGRRDKFEDCHGTVELPTYMYKSLSDWK